MKLWVLLVYPQRPKVMLFSRKKQTSVRKLLLMITPTYFSKALSKREAANKIQQKLIMDMLKVFRFRPKVSRLCLHGIHANNG